MSYEYIRRQNSEDPTKYALQFEIELLNKKLLKKKIKIMDLKKEIKFNEIDMKKLNKQIKILNDNFDDLEKSYKKLIHKHHYLKKIVIVCFILFINFIKVIYEKKN